MVIEPDNRESDTDKGEVEYRKCLELIEHHFSRLENAAMEGGRDYTTFLMALLQVTLGRLFTTSDSEERALATQNYVIERVKSVSKRIVQSYSKVNLKR